MSYVTFTSMEEALELENKIAAAEGYPKVGLNAASSEPQPDCQLTTAWAVPLVGDVEGEILYKLPSEEISDKLSPDTQATYKDRPVKELAPEDTKKLPTPKDKVEEDGTLDPS